MKKQFKNFANDNGLDFDQIWDEVQNESEDFNVDGFRFILKDEIDRIQTEELESDNYMLGCFNAWLIADVLDMDTDVIEAMQKAEAFEAIGKLIKSMGKVGDMQQDYVSADGYGHHFAHYDHNEHEVGNYYAFRVD